MPLTNLLILVAIMLTSLTLASATFENDTQNKTKNPLVPYRRNSTHLLLSISDISREGLSLNTVCKWFHVHPSNCSCPHSKLVCQALFFHKLAGKNDSWVTVFIRQNMVTVVYATIAVVSSIFGMIGNAMVLLIAWHHRSKLSPAKLHVAELAVVNFLFSAVQIINVSPLYWTSDWIYGQFMCKFTKSILEAGSLLSSGFFQLITVERYFLIVRAANSSMIKKISERIKHAVLVCNLIIVGFTVVPYIHGVGIEPESKRCVNFAHRNKSLALPYTWLTFIIYSVLPIIVCSVLAVKLLAFLSNEGSSSSMVSREKVNARIMLNMLGVLTLFIVCTLPSRFVFIAMDMVEFKSHGVLLGFQFLSYILYSLQGTLNPILYNMMAKEWRRNLTGVMQGFVGKLYRENSSIHPL